MSIVRYRRNLLIALGTSPALLASRSLLAQAPLTPQEGSDYTVLANPQPTDAPGKVEVLDFFWYGCPHCYAFLPDLERWRKRQGADVAVRHIPVAFDPHMEPHTKIFCTLQLLGRVEDLHVKVFDAYHIRRLRLLDREEIAGFMASNGIPREKWLATYDSFSVAGCVSRARLTTQAYTIDGTPTIAVDGRFLTSPSIVRSHSAAGALGVMDYLVDRVRREHAGKKG